MPLNKLQIAGVLGKYETFAGALPLKSRQAKLKAFKKVLLSRKKDIIEAMKGDLWRQDRETIDAEVRPLLEIISFLIKKLPSLCKRRLVSDSIFTFPSLSYTVAEPFGRVLVVGSWNYPFLLALEPTLGAYAAGNRVILKLSRRSPRAMHLITDLVETVFDPEEVMVIGDIMPLAEVLKYRYDFIFATGSASMGHLVMRAASGYLTPMVLELGGRNPCIVASGADLKTAAKRIVWSKFFNAGQSCIAPDHLLVYRKLKPQLLNLLNFYIRKFYGNCPLEEFKFPSLPDREAYERICRLISSGRLVYGGGRDPQRFAVEPTVIDQLPPDSPVFKEEIFGPVLPVMEFFSEEELLVQLKQNPRPLALYCFGGSKQLHRQLKENIPSGATVFNDVMLQFANMHLPFGGIGNSGFGAYHGRLTFETFCHRKAVMYKPNFPDWPPRYPGGCLE